MSEIRSIEWNGKTAASLFAGAGGSCTGYRMAGYHVVYANEFIPAAADTYRLNHPETILDTRDIRIVRAADIVNQVGHVDLLDGSPPCAAFSTAGKREQGWGQIKNYSGVMQQVDDLFFEYARILRELRPKVFVAENVSGLVKGVAKGYFVAIVTALKECGYNVQVRLLNGARLGVPQSRERIIFVGTRKDLPINPDHPKPLPYTYTLRDALYGCPSGEKRFAEKGSKTEVLYWHTPRGRAFTESALKVYGQKDSWHSHTRLSWDKPAPTILQGAASAYHPDECRSLTIPELKRVCSLPDDYKLTGSFKEQWERLGRSVPPVMMKHIAETIRDRVLHVCR